MKRLFLVLLLFDKLFGQNIILNSSFDDLNGNNITPRQTFKYWSHTFSPTSFDLEAGHVNPPLKSKSQDDVVEYTNLFTNIEGMATNNFAILNMNAEPEGFYQYLNAPLKSGYYYFSIKVKQLFDTVNCQNCNLPLQILFSKGVIDHYDIQGIKRSKLLTVPLHDNASVANPWIKYNFKIKLSGKINMISISHFQMTGKMDRTEYHEKSKQNTIFLIDDVTLLPLRNQDSVFPAIEKRTLKEVFTSGFIVDEMYYYKELLCFPNYMACLGDKAIRRLDSLAYIMKNSSDKLVIVIPATREKSKNIADNIYKYLYYYIEDKNRIEIEYTDVNYDPKYIDYKDRDVDCPGTYWSMVDLFPPEYEKLQVGFKMQLLNEPVRLPYEPK